MVPHFSDDIVTMGLQAATHWDSLAHVSYNHTLYNGVPTSTITARDGATVLGIDTCAPPRGSRGVLLDLPAAKGLDQLAAGHEVTGDDLDEAAEFGRVEDRRAATSCSSAPAACSCFFSGGSNGLHGRSRRRREEPGPVVRRGAVVPAPRHRGRGRTTPTSFELFPATGMAQRPRRALPRHRRHRA